MTKEETVQESLAGTVAIVGVAGRSGRTKSR